MGAVIKKELKSYFLSPIGYIAIGVFLITFSVFFYLTAIQSGSVDLGALYYYVALYGMMIITPILTMRMFSEERKTGTEQLILTAPVNMIEVVIGKFLAALSLVGITLVISLMYFAIVSFFGSPNIVVLLVNLLGFVLLSSAAISFGMFASSITENQVIAAIITIAYMIIPLFLPDFSSIFSNLAFISFYSNFAMGVISFTDIVGLTTFTLMFMAFTVIVMQRRKLIK